MNDPPSPGAARVNVRPSLGRRLSGLVDVADPRASGTVSRVLAIWVAWMVLALLANLAHEPWRDELQAWAIADAAGTPLDIFGALRWEGHPPGWYLLLWPVTRVLPFSVGLPLVNLAVGGTATWLVLRNFPVHLVVRTALVFGYFPLFELGAISRSYGLLWLLVVVALTLVTHGRARSWWMVAVLIGICTTTVLAIPLAVAFAVTLWADPRIAPDCSPRWLPGLTAVVGGALVVGVTSLPERGGGPRTLATGSVDLSDPAEVTNALLALDAPLTATIPVTEPFTGFWQEFWLGDLGRLGIVSGLILVGVVAWILRRRLPALALWVLGGVGSLVVLVLADRIVAARFSTPLWAAGVAATWLACRQRLADDARPPLHPVVALGVAGVLTAGLWASGWAVATDITSPFSGAEGAAEWIRADAGDADVVLLCVASPSECAPVGERLGSAVYMSADGEPFRYVEWRRGYKRRIPAADAAAAAGALAERTGTPVYVVTFPSDPPPGCEAGWQSDEPPIVENLLVCRADQLTPPPVPG